MRNKKKKKKKEKRKKVSFKNLVCENRVKKISKSNNRTKKSEAIVKVHQEAWT